MAVDSVSAASQSQDALQNGGVIQKAGASDSLDMTDFFTLMAAQLQYQDPSSPTDTSTFMGQMAQFGMLEQLQTLSKQYNYMTGASLVGKSVSYSVYDDLTGETTTGSGTVQEVDIGSGSTACKVDGKWVDLSDINKFSAQSSGNGGTAV